MAGCGTKCLNTNWFLNPRNAKRKIGASRQDYNQARPYSASGYVPPEEFAAQFQEGGSTEADALMFCGRTQPICL
jgi:transposase InsO family protein